MRIARFTEWTKIRSRNRELYGQKYRILRATDANDSPVYYLQFQVSTTNPKSSMNTFKVSATVLFEGGEETTTTVEFEMTPSWAGALYGSLELSTEIMKKSVESVTLAAVE